MLLMDVNVFVYAFREDTPHHENYKTWLEDVINGPSLFGYSELVLSGFLRIVTHQKIFEQPASLPDALFFAEQIINSENALLVKPGDKHWFIFSELASSISASGNDIPDVYHAALAMEWGCEWVTADKGFKRFKGLNVLMPFK